jgi:hypothetical protein
MRMSTEASIFEPREANRSQIHFEVTVQTAGGEPVANVDVVFRLQGQGSLAPGNYAGQVSRETDAQGKARATWYRRGIFGREVNATLSVTCERPDVNLTLEELGTVDLGPRTGWVPEPPLGRQ